MSDYLWDKTGEADPEVERLEEMLGAFAHRPRPLELPAKVGARPRRFTLSQLAAAAALLLLIGGVYMRQDIVEIWPPAARLFETVGLTVDALGAGLQLQHVRSEKRV